MGRPFHREQVPQGLSVRNGVASADSLALQWNQLFMVLRGVISRNLELRVAGLMGADLLLLAGNGRALDGSDAGLRLAREPWKSANLFI